MIILSVAENLKENLIRSIRFIFLDTISQINHPLPMQVTFISAAKII